MRVTVRENEPIQVIDSRTPVNLVLQVFDPVNVFFAMDRFSLDRVDAGLNPLGGFSLTNAAPPFTIEDFVGTLWARCAVQTEIEVHYQ